MSTSRGFLFIALITVASVSTVTAWAAADMAAVPPPLPGALNPGQTANNLSVVCTNVGDQSATVATCDPSASSGSIDALACTPTPPVASLAPSDSITCNFDFTAPGTQGGADEPASTVTITTTTFATNDTNPANDSATASANIVDALDESATLVGSTPQSYDVGANDTLGTQAAAAAGATFSLDAGSSCLTPAMNPSTGVATFTTPSQGTCTIEYVVCAPPPDGAACDKATLTVTVASSDMAVSNFDEPAVVAPGVLLPGLAVECTNIGTGDAAGALCGAQSSDGTVSNVQCTPAVPVATLAPGGRISCTYDFRGPGVTGGADEPLLTAVIEVTTGANNDGNAANDTRSITVPLLDAVDDARDVTANAQGLDFPLGDNDEMNGPLPAGVSFSLGTSTCANAQVDGSTGVVIYDAPASGSCQLTYTLCAPAPNQSVCDTAQFTATAVVPPPIVPLLGGWAVLGLLALAPLGAALTGPRWRR